MNEKDLTMDDLSIIRDALTDMLTCSDHYFADGAKNVLKKFDPYRILKQQKIVNKLIELRESENPLTLQEIITKLEETLMNYEY